MKRESFQSRLGFLLVSAGCAIGIGNVWKFPYVTGENGGGVFVLFYLLFLIVMGVPVLTMELAVGRASRKSAVQGYAALEPQGSRWHIHGWFCVIGCYLLMMYYTTVSGWMLGYFFKFASGTFTGLQGEAIDNMFFVSTLGNPGEMACWMAVTVLAGILVCSFGLQNGLERITKVMMLGLLGLIVVLAVHSLLLPGAAEGVRFYLRPDFGRAAEMGIGKVITAAMNQAFFTLSLGIAAMEIFGSYMSRDNTLTGEAVRICSLDTFVALMSGLIIFPACFSFNVQPDSGPSLIFITLPKVFVNMAGGRLWGTLFFLFMTFASFSTVIAGYNLWSGFHPLLGKDVLDSEDFLVSNLLLPIGSLIYLLFCVMPMGWKYDSYLAEANTGKGLKLPSRGTPKVLMQAYLSVVLPVLILVILIQGLPTMMWKTGVCIAVLALIGIMSHRKKS